MTNRINFKLVTGVVLICLFFIIAIFGPNLAPYDISYSKKIGYIDTKKGKMLVGSPFPPSRDFVFGTDNWGYDILTLLLNGLKYTLFIVCFVALIRLVIGSSLGIFQALNSKIIKRKKPGISFLSGLPPFIIIYFIMVGINIDPILTPRTLIIIQSILMIILGISGVYNVVYEKTNEVCKSLFVDAARSLGGSKLHIMKKHILPTLKSNLFIIFVNEAIQVLHLIGQLAIFNLFLGGTKVEYYPIIYFSKTNEWSGLIGQSRAYLYHFQWVILFPLLFYLLLLFSFYLLSQGLNQRKREIHRKNLYL